MHSPSSHIKTEVNELQELMKELTLEQQQELLNRGREMIKMTKMEIALAELRTKPGIAGQNDCLFPNSSRI